MRISPLSVLVTLGLSSCAVVASAFVGNDLSVRRSAWTTTIKKTQNSPTVTRQSTTARAMFEDTSSFDATFSSAAASSSNFWLATIDADIAKLSDNEFAPIFMGGIGVMAGGLLSALIVGFILKSNNSYADVVADSYEGTNDDDDFWDNLTDEEKIKVEGMMKQVSGENSSIAETMQALKEKSAKAKELEAETAAAAPVKKQEDLDMFSDYSE